ncbi:MAG: helix-turn-helix transcriptional regulator [Ruminococcaceae bacterium]|nr:helix-turn-helix transcriptional regulator [Oscillospiraceae bacterium]
MVLNHKMIGVRVKEVRILKQLSQADLAEFTDLSVSYISHIETGLKKASLESLVRISNVLGITVDQLLYGNQVSDKKQYCNELTELVKDCNTCEKRIIYDVALAVKESLRGNEWMKTNQEPTSFYY